MTLFRTGAWHPAPSLQQSPGTRRWLSGTRPGGPPAQGMADDRAPAAAVRPGPLRVGVVEDEAIIALELEDILAALGAEVVGTALSADEAVRLAETERPDCMTMDIRLQGRRDGVSAAIEIYERFGIRCVFVSAYGDPDTVARAERANPLGWLSKPIRQRGLGAALDGFRNGRDGP